MESKRRFIYVDITHIYKQGEFIFMREPDWFPKLRPKFKKLYREASVHEQAS